VTDIARLTAVEIFSTTITAIPEHAKTAVHTHSHLRPSETKTPGSQTPAAIALVVIPAAATAVMSAAIGFGLNGRS
jgi:hypothetical protein